MGAIKLLYVVISFKLLKHVPLDTVFLIHCLEHVVVYRAFGEEIVVKYLARLPLTVHPAHQLHVLLAIEGQREPADCPTP